MGDEEKEPFWNFYRILIVITFAAGLILGGIATNQIIDPILTGNYVQDQNSLTALNDRLDSRVDQLYNCLLENDVSPAVCG
tara:strand:+ start:2585 stop:2827 length:243 start_codon:yes stop_codon:yes gene_type:complete